MCTNAEGDAKSPPAAFISRVGASWSRSASSLEKMHVSNFWRHTMETMSRQSFSGFAAVNCISPCTSRNGDACEHIGTLAPVGKKLIRIRSPHGVLVTSAIHVFKLLRLNTCQRHHLCAPRRPLGRRSFLPFSSGRQRPRFLEQSEGQPPSCV